MSRAMLECPRFNHCAVNNCPLHVEYPDLPMLPEEDGCKLGKKRRVSIGAWYPDLKYRGMKSREFHAAERTAKMTNEEIENRRQLAKNRLSPTI